MAGILENGKLITRFVAPMSIISNRPVFVADTLSLRRQTTSQGVQRWEIKTNVEPSNSSADLLVHSVTNSFDNIIDIQMPQVYRVGNLGTTTTSIITVNSSTVNKGSTQVVITGNNGIIRKGEFIQFANHDKVYMVTKDLQNNGTLNIFPNLITNIPLGIVISYGNNVVLKARYDTDSIQGIVFTDGILSDPGTLTFVEAV